MIEESKIPNPLSDHNHVEILCTDHMSSTHLMSLGCAAINHEMYVQN